MRSELRRHAPFGGKAKNWLDELREKMKTYASLWNLKGLLSVETWLMLFPNREKPDALQKNGQFNPRTTALPESKEVRNLKNLPHIIECFDISHVSGTFVASMARFRWKSR